MGVSDVEKRWYGRSLDRKGGRMLTSAVLGTDSQKTSILMSPAVVWSVTDMADDKQSRCSAHHAASRGLMSSGKTIQTDGQPYRILRGLEAAFAASTVGWNLPWAWLPPLGARQRNLLAGAGSQGIYSKSSVPSDLSHPANPKACSTTSCTVYTITFPLPVPHSLRIPLRTPLVLAD